MLPRTRTEDMLSLEQLALALVQPDRSTKTKTKNNTPRYRAFFISSSILMFLSVD